LSHPDYAIQASQAITMDGRALLFGRCRGSDLPDEVEALWPIIWEAEVAGGKVGAWRAYQDRPRRRRLLGMSRGKSTWLSVPAVAAEIDADLNSLLVDKAPNRERVHRGYYQRMRTAHARQVMRLAHMLIERYDQRGAAYMIIHHHAKAMRYMTAKKLERLGQGMDSWGNVDCFSLYVAGPTWRIGRIDDEVIHEWARSEDRWWRRAALSCTVALNVEDHGGDGDPARTLAVCEMLAADHDDMVVKALSWTLRELVQHDRGGVERFVNRHDQVMAGRAKREVRNKLQTGAR
jgi:3-methyladenine DNA glycosylase AlkD